MKALRFAALWLTALFAFASVPAQESTVPAPLQIFSGALQRVMNLIEPPPGSPVQTFSVNAKITQAVGASKALVGSTAEVALQAPDRFALSAQVEGKSYALGRNGQQLWVYVPAKKFGVVGAPGLPRFASAPGKKDDTKLDPLQLPVLKEQVLLFPLLTEIKMLPDETIGGARCYAFTATPRPEALKLLRIPPGQFQLAVRASDLLPLRIGYSDGTNLQVTLEFSDPKLTEPAPATRWSIPSREGDTIETTALSHLTRFVPVAFANLTQTIRTLPPATGQRQVVASEGKGRLEMVDGTRVLFLQGTPEEMGRQHGVLLKKQVRNLTDRILYGVGVGSSFVKGRWFFREIEQAQQRLMPHIDSRYLREVDALALASGCEKEEIRLANFFPELFHCSGFALYGQATAGGHMFHGRVLDYLRGMGLEQNAVVIVSKPDRGNAWVNISYAGFLGSVTAMNEKQIAIGEMGGRGEGNWDGKPMAQLVREVMENASTIEQAIEIMRKGPRTCEYYYVISDAKARRAVGIAATPEKFETIEAGQTHPRLPTAFKDVVLMSADERYRTLAERVRDGYGKFDATSARDLMKRPVAMRSNIHSVLFQPDTLDFWVANADSKNVASETEYRHYNLGELLR